MVPLIPWPTRWTGVEQFSIVCLIRLWTTSTSHDSSRSCSNDHLLTSKCWPKLCAVRLKRQYSDGWRSIQSIWLVLIWFYFSYFLMLLIMVPLRVDVWLYSFLHLGWSSFLLWTKRQQNLSMPHLFFDPCNQFFFNRIGLWFVPQHVLIDFVAYFVETGCIQILIYQTNFPFSICFHLEKTLSFHLFSPKLFFAVSLYDQIRCCISYA